MGIRLRISTERGSVIRKLLTVSTVAALFIGAAAPAQAAEPALANGTAWLKSPLIDFEMPGPVPFPGMPPSTDWGLTIDALIALRAAKLEPETAGKIADKLEAKAVAEYGTGESYGAPDYIDGGSMAKILFAAVVAGRNPADFGGDNVRQLTLDQVDADGWLVTTYAGTRYDVGNMFDQSLAVLGFSGSGTVPEKLLALLLKQQCADGGFPISLKADADGDCSTGLEPIPGPPSGKPQADVDATAMAIQALYAAGKTAAADKAAAWLMTVQQAEGGFAVTGSATVAANSNSTGLAGQALYAGGKLDEAEKAAKFLRSLQLTAANAGAASAHAGAIAWQKDHLAAAAANGIEGQLDTWIRASAQALLGLSKVSMHRVGIDSPPVPPTSAPSSSAPAVPPAGDLPVTGAPVTTLTFAGAGVVLAGVVLVLVARRRRESAR